MISQRMITLLGVTALFAPALAMKGLGTKEEKCAYTGEGYGFDADPQPGASGSLHRRSRSQHATNSLENSNSSDNPNSLDKNQIIMVPETDMLKSKIEELQAQITRHQNEMEEQNQEKQNLLQTIQVKDNTIDAKDTEIKTEKDLVVQMDAIILKKNTYIHEDVRRKIKSNGRKKKIAAGFGIFGAFASAVPFILSTTVDFDPEQVMMCYTSGAILCGLFLVIVLGILSHIEGGKLNNGHFQATIGFVFAAGLCVGGSFIANQAFTSAENEAFASDIFRTGIFAGAAVILILLCCMGIYAARKSPKVIVVVTTMLGGLAAASGLIMNTPMFEDHFMKEMPDLAEYLVFGGIALALISIFCCLFTKHEGAGAWTNYTIGVGIATTVAAGCIAATKILTDDVVAGNVGLDESIQTFVENNMDAIYIFGGIAGLCMLIGIGFHILNSCKRGVAQAPAQPLDKLPFN